ncbi:hypothetical protein B0J15DRAFT_466261 [Fusarium solani]|uniref:Uncharacterized protein n=1 Tax=Fusarium solani TaxID=169388 RepID=A0A9P9KB03_FUSSL|nr:uncharacterized protein B0J15DRAFT_466261 [Fusarium solani]KAH7254593.1 hypothetical protein B0J15DRAFT_466261 [Fusarium solani]
MALSRWIGADLCSITLLKTASPRIVYQLGQIPVSTEFPDSPPLSLLQQRKHDPQQPHSLRSFCRLSIIHVLAFLMTSFVHQSDLRVPPGSPISVSHKAHLTRRRGGQAPRATREQAKEFFDVTTSHYSYNNKSIQPPNSAKPRPRISAQDPLRQPGNSAPGSGRTLGIRVEQYIRTKNHVPSDGIDKLFIVSDTLKYPCRNLDHPPRHNILRVNLLRFEKPTFVALLVHGSRFSSFPPPYPTPEGQGPRATVAKSIEGGPFPD